MSRIERLTEALQAQPRFPLATLPTPLVYAPRFSEKVGGQIWLKRDDLTGLALGGNKARKVEFLFGRAARDGDVDTVVTVGAAQSNHARTVAAGARLAGWECHLVLGGHRPPRPSGNLVLDTALSAHLHFAGTDSWSELESRAAELVDQLRAAGKRPLLIPIGGSTPVGALGFVGAYLELLAQLDSAGVQPAAIVHATSSGGTQAGLDYAHHVVGRGPRVIGVGVAKTDAELTDEVAVLRDALADLLGIDAEFPPPTVLPGYLGAGYAAPTAGAQAAFDALATTEAVFTDFVYSAKALHAVIDHAREDQRPVVFWHTGGVPALFSDTSGITAWPGNPAYSTGTETAQPQ